MVVPIHSPYWHSISEHHPAMAHNSRYLFLVAGRLEGHLLTAVGIPMHGPFYRAVGLFVKRLAPAPDPPRFVAVRSYGRCSLDVLFLRVQPVIEKKQSFKHSRCILRCLWTEGMGNEGHYGAA